MKSSHWQWAGIGLSVIGVAYLAMRLWGQADQLLQTNIPATAWWVAGLLGLLYGMSNGLLARAWWELLCHQRAVADWPRAFRIYGVSQLAKYVPGNMFHLVGRQALGLAQGLPGRALAVAAGWEMVSLAVGACLFAAWLLQLLWPGWRSEFGAMLFCASVLALAAGAGHFGSRQLGRAFVWHLAFLVSTGGMFVVTFAVLSDQLLPWQAVPALGAAYVLAWLAGLLTPGAPAGLGVREVAVVLLLEDAYFAPTVLLLAVLVMRFVTVAGDLVFFGLAWRCRAGDRAIEN